MRWCGDILMIRTSLRTQIAQAKEATKIAEVSLRPDEALLTQETLGGL